MTYVSVCQRTWVMLSNAHDYNIHVRFSCRWHNQVYCLISSNTIYIYINSIQYICWFELHTHASAGHFDRPSFFLCSHSRCLGQALTSPCFQHVGLSQSYVSSNKFAILRFGWVSSFETPILHGGFLCAEKWVPFDCFPWGQKKRSAATCP